MNLKEIKDAARKAFSDQQSQDTEGGVHDAVSFIAGFLEGARHRQGEIDELSEGLDHYIKEASIYANASKQHFKEVQKLKREIEVLRQYGNKDCTAMADEVLDNE